MSDHKASGGSHAAGTIFPPRPFSGSLTQTANPLHTLYAMTMRVKHLLFYLEKMIIKMPDTGSAFCSQIFTDQKEKDYNFTHCACKETNATGECLALKLENLQPLSSIFPNQRKEKSESYPCTISPKIQPETLLDQN